VALKNAHKSLTNSWQTVYTAPASTTARIIHCQVAGSFNPTAPLGLRWRDSSASANVTLCDDVPVPDNAALAPIAGELVLLAGDSISAKSNGSGRLTISLSIDETT